MKRMTKKRQYYPKVLQTYTIPVEDPLDVRPNENRSYRNVCMNQGVQDVIPKIEPWRVSSQPYEDIRDCMKIVTSESIGHKYTILKEIARGTYGIVYRGFHNGPKKEPVAIKKIKFLTAYSGQSGVINEVQCLQRLGRFDHPNVVRFIDVKENIDGPTCRTFFLVFELLQGDLRDFLADFDGQIPLPSISSIMNQILNGVDYLHCTMIIHRDLKPSNLLMSEDGIVKITDFGTAMFMKQGRPLPPIKATLCYAAPEILLRSTYSTPADIWSCGAIFAELLIGHPLFEADDEAKQLKKIIKIVGAPDPWPKDSQIVKPHWILPSGTVVNFLPMIPRLQEVGSFPGHSLLQQMLSPNPSARGSAAALLSHRYFKTMWGM